MKKRVLFLVLFIAGVTASAQQDAQFSMWMFDKVSFNPAAAGLNDMHNFTLFHRDQWDMLDRDPKTYMFNYDGKFMQDLPNFGFGLNASTDALGQETTNIIRLTGAYHYQLKSIGILSGGISIGSYAKKLGTDWRAIDPNDAVVLAVSGTETSSSVFDFSLGFMLKATDYYAGISMTHLSQGELTDLNIDVLRTYWIMGGYDYTIPSNPNLVLRSNILAKTDFNALQYDINVNALFNNSFWGGLSYRGKDALAPMAGYIYQLPTKQTPTSKMVSQIQAGVSYDVGLSDLKTYHNGSYEIFVKFSFAYTPIVLKKPHHNPRWLGRSKIK